jgi:hypothetical protein
MHLLKALAITLVLTLALVFGGCNTTKQRPAPIRPKATMSPSVSPTGSPSGTTKRLPGVSKVSKKDIESRLVKIEDHVKKGNWSVANREVNSLGGDMARFYPSSAKGKSLREMAVMDTDYGKLQLDVKTKKKDSALKNCTKIRKTLGTVK